MLVVVSATCCLELQSYLVVCKLWQGALHRLFLVREMLRAMRVFAVGSCFSA
jgi:hypothetical protein